MSTEASGSPEERIAHVLLEQWDPLGVHEQPGPHAEYAAHAHALFGLLMRGGSDTQVERYLRQIERDELKRPDLEGHDLTGVVRSLRAIERTS